MHHDLEIITCGLLKYKMAIFMLRHDFFLLVELLEKNVRFRDGVGGGEINKKSSENDQLIGHFQSFFYISRKNSKTSKVNQQSVLNL